MHLLCILRSAPLYRVWIQGRRGGGGGASLAALVQSAVRSSAGSQVPQRDQEQTGPLHFLRAMLTVCADLHWQAQLYNPQCCRIALAGCSTLLEKADKTPEISLLWQVDVEQITQMFT